MRLSFDIRIGLDGRELNAQLCALIEALGRHGSLAAAARAVGCSYRHAWNLLRGSEDTFREPLVIMQRGRGARLSFTGEQLVAGYKRAQSDTAEMLARIATETTNALVLPRPTAGGTVRISASHDLALLELKRHLGRKPAAVELAIQFRGSLQALEDLAQGRCDLAGFHTGPDAGVDDVFRHLLSARHFQLIILAGRRQGLMLAAGNPKRIKGIADLTRRGIRFVNRQAGSGTRLLFDRLLAASRQPPAAITGYNDEEFTHVAVAATVASGHADAAFGIEAAAAEFGLTFVSVSSETYFLALRRVQLQREPIRQLLRHMQSQGFRKRIAQLPGYDVARCGSVVDVPAGLRATFPSDAAVKGARKSVASAGHRQKLR